MREFENENTVVGLPWAVGWLNSVGLNVFLEFIE